MDCYFIIEYFRMKLQQKKRDMIKIKSQAQVPLPPTLSIGFKQRSIDHNAVELSSIQSDAFENQSGKFPKRIIIFNHQQFQKIQEILQWRQNTGFPIIKLKSFRILQKNFSKKQNFHQILIELESKMTSFESIKKLVFFQAIYILKESMIGFERLCHRFGFFDISKKMIKFNVDKVCKVWINADCFQHKITQNQIKSQDQFISKLCSIVEQKLAQSKMSFIFFKQIKNCKYFFQAIRTIDQYVKLNKIKMPNKLQNFNQTKSNYQATQEKQKTQYFKIPIFIKNSLLKKKNSLIEVRYPRKMTLMNEKPTISQSLTKISRNYSSNSFTKKHSINYMQTSIQDLKNKEDNLINKINVHQKFIKPNRQRVKSSFLTKIYSNYIYTPQFYYNPKKMITSAIGIEDAKKSGHSFNKIRNNKDFSPFKDASKLISLAFKSQKINLNNAKKKKISHYPKGFKTFQHIYLTNQNSLKNLQAKQNKFIPLSLNEIKMKKKNSMEIKMGTQFCQKQEIKSFRENQEAINQCKNYQFIKISKNASNQSLQVMPTMQIAFSQPCFNRKVNNINKQEKEQEFLRDDLKKKNVWTGLQALQQNKDIQISFISNKKQVSPAKRSKTSEIPKLGVMGRYVRTSMIDEFEFELEYENRIMKQRCVRQEINELFA